MERPTEEHAIPTRRLYGVVYDIETLRPVSGAQIKFSVSGGNLTWATKTDQRGHYQIDLIENPQHVILVSAEAPGYRKGALEDSDPPLRLSKAKRRRALVEETTDHDLAESLVRLGGSDNIIQFDLVVFPERPR
ncbi:MAG: carboxypeptidase-like regulatory domain-containing protein [Elusimicrobiota bacterium]|nr:MAG: carboxypeptidase-like regulatory domain-containing protein [Elusimicrobiota bacterium]